jgi:GxxExxY protein
MGHDFEALSGIVLAAAVDVHREFGPGFLEATYAQALQVGLDQRGLRYSTEHVIPLRFRGHPVGEYRLDLLIEGSMVVELKTVRRFSELHFAQVRAYLKASGCRVGLLLNFNASVLAIRRVVYDPPQRVVAR